MIGYCSYLGRKAICRQPQSCSQLPSRDPPLPVSPGWQPDYSIFGFLPAACIASSFPRRVGALQFLLPLFAAHFTASCSLLLKAFLNCMYSREYEKIWMCTHINGGPGGGEKLYIQLQNPSKWFNFYICCNWQHLGNLKSKGRN